MTKNATALVTGGAGFIGLHLSAALAEQNKAVTIADNLSRGKMDPELKLLAERDNVEFIEADLTNPAGLMKLGKPENFDFVYHLAAINGTRYFYEKPEQVLRVNILSAINILDWFSAQKKNRSKIVFSSSSEAYAGGVSLGVSKIPTPETAPLVIEDVTNPRWSYGGSKIAGELLFMNYARHYGFPLSIVRYHNIYGPRMGNDHVIPEFIMRAAKDENPFKIQGGEQTRAFCFVDDAVRATILVAESEKTNNEIIHIGNNLEEIKISELAKKIIAAAGSNAEIETTDMPEGSVMRRCPDITKLRTLTGYEPGIMLDAGLKKTAEWYLNGAK
ncbi:MAG: SDR family NAD(P)-dependent oxidoreductase [Candidatus Diapherotrites archaeon]|nr:SDR family NAD(P)-dependent oxidoreductase [Candidatus Micrarchaeota archaeon]MBU1939804.1 SDR family NAD(P)-dependent oxidoreductase [Candidatus Micrarchaeota archaeon]